MNVGELKQMLNGLSDDMVITTDLTNRHWRWTKTPVLEGLYSTHKNNKDVVVLCFHEPYWDENAMDLVEVLP